LSTLQQYLSNKSEAMRAASRSYGSGAAVRETIAAECSASDLTGIRRIQIRDFRFLSDSGPAFGGFGLGPSSPELLLGVLASCLTHTYLIGAAKEGIPLDSVRVRFEAENNDAGFLGLATMDPELPFNIRALVHLESSAETERVARLHDWARRSCPLTKLIREAHTVTIETAGGDR
jgi:uncharacterized OsmC-like protein